MSSPDSDTPIEMPPHEQSSMLKPIDIEGHRFPYCVVWTPLPIITWLLPFIGHMGIADSSGIIYDFAGPYTVSKNNMAFGWPTKYWRLETPNNKYDQSVYDASEEYKTRMHILCYDNCHSHVAMAMNLMRHGEKSRWNMISVCFAFLWHSRYVSIGGFIKTWLPFILWATILTVILAIWGP